MLQYKYFKIRMLPNPAVYFNPIFPLDSLIVPILICLAMAYHYITIVKQDAIEYSCSVCAVAGIIISTITFALLNSTA
jgi:hypothetical protein